MSFKQWLCKDGENRRLLTLSGILMTVQFAWFKFMYPFPNFMPPDSNSYLTAAFNNQTINVWPIGYSKFLRLVSSFTNSHFALTLIQYLLLEASLLYFLFTLKYLLPPGKWVFRLLIVCNVLNPLVPHISNFVSSDGLFATLSLVWFTQLLWMLFKPTQRLVIWHAFVLLFAFMVRYNALFYPFISIVILTFTHLSVKTKLKGAGLIVLLLGSFVVNSIHKYYVATGTIQYSGFGGWLMAGNALYGYSHAKPEPVEKVPIKFRELHTLVNRHMDSIRHLSPRPDAEVGVYYVWDLKSPLRVYMNRKYGNDPSVPYLIPWAKAAPLYEAYGRYLIIHYPWLFIRYYMWPNFIRYCAPPANFMGLYNLGEAAVAPITVTWFGWKDNKIATRDKTITIGIADLFTVIMAVINLVFILCFIGFIWLGGIRKCHALSKQILWWMLAIWLCNMGFSVFTAPIELRYQFFPIIVTFAFAMLVINCLVREFAAEPTIQENHLVLPVAELVNKY